jgi:hypothetical protein
VRWGAAEQLTTDLGVRGSTSLGRAIFSAHYDTLRLADPLLGTVLGTMVKTTTASARVGREHYPSQEQMGHLDHYGHTRPLKSADRILLGLPGWQSNHSEMAPSG